MQRNKNSLYNEIIPIKFKQFLRKELSYGVQIKQIYK